MIRLASLRSTATGLLVAACLVWPFAALRAGIPPRSLPRLIRLQDELAALDPRQFSIAVECDAHLSPPGAPLLVLGIHAATPGRFAAIDETLPLVRAAEPSTTTGLPALVAGRQRLYFVLAPAALSRLGSAQNRLRELQGRREGRDGTLVRLALEQATMLPAARDLAGSRWDAWLQSDRREGWYPVWTGTLRELAEESRSDGE